VMNLHKYSKIIAKIDRKFLILAHIYTIIINITQQRRLL